MNAEQPDGIEAHVLAVLAGRPLEHAAALASMEPGDLADAVETYKAAGRGALHAQARIRGWYQVRIQFTDWDTAEQTAAAGLSPHLRQAQEAGIVADWWFLRKHPCWRLRCLPGRGATRTQMAEVIGVVLDTMIADGTVEQWWESLYEPEDLTFGGPKGMGIAHDLFHADSQGTLTFLWHTPRMPSDAVVGRRELSILLCTNMFRSARQDTGEQADIWHRVVSERPLATEPSPDDLRGMIPNLRRLMSLDTSPTGTLFATGSPLAFAAEWSGAFAIAGKRLGDAARDGTLQRGLRDTLASHVIFHWNRLGLAAQTQAVLARACRTTLMNSTTDGMDQ